MCVHVCMYVLGGEGGSLSLYMLFLGLNFGVFPSLGRHVVSAVVAGALKNITFLCQNLLFIKR